MIYLYHISQSKTSSAIRTAMRIQFRALFAQRNLCQKASRVIIIMPVSRLVCLPDHTCNLLYMRVCAHVASIERPHRGPYLRRTRCLRILRACRAISPPSLRHGLLSRGSLPSPSLSLSPSFAFFSLEDFEGSSSPRCFLCINSMSTVYRLLAE